MLAASGRRLNTYTAVPESTFSRPETRFRYFDETPYVCQLADTNGNIVAHFIPPSNAPLLEQIREVVRIGGAPFSGLNALWSLDLLKAARSAGHDVMLTGNMGNEIMSYNGSALPAQLLLSGRWWRLALEIVHCRTRKKRMIRQDLILPFVPRVVLQRYRQWRRRGEPAWRSDSAFNGSFLAATSGFLDRAARAQHYLDAPPLLNGKRVRILDLKNYSETADRFAKLRAGIGVDIRTPAFDRRLVEFCIGIPEDQYLHKGESRWLIRRAMAGRLPEVVLANHKIGSQAADWFPRMTRELTEIRREIDRLAGRSHVASIINMKALTAAVDNWPNIEPVQSSTQALRLSLDLPAALSAAIFINNVTDSNRELPLAGAGMSDIRTWL